MSILLQGPGTWNSSATESGDADWASADSGTGDADWALLWPGNGFSKPLTFREFSYTFRTPAQQSLVW